MYMIDSPPMIHDLILLVYIQGVHGEVDYVNSSSADPIYIYTSLYLKFV